MIDGELILNAGAIKSPNKVSVPFRADFVLKTDSNDIRIGYGAGGGVTFNWKVKPELLRFQDPLNHGFSEMPGKGSVPVNQFVKITWINDVDEVRVLVDGDEPFARTATTAICLSNCRFGPGSNRRLLSSPFQ